MALGDEEHTNSKTSYTAEEVKAHFKALKEAQNSDISQGQQEKKEPLIRSPFQPGEKPGFEKWVIENPDHKGTFTRADMRPGEAARDTHVAYTPDGEVLTPNDIVEALSPKDQQEPVTAYAQETTQINVDGLSNNDYAGNAKAVFGASFPEATNAELKTKVQEMQRMIGVQADGLIGPNTKAALQQWQEQNPGQSITDTLGKNNAVNVAGNGERPIHDIRNDPIPDWAQGMEMVTGVFPGSPNGANTIAGQSNSNAPKWTENLEMVTGVFSGSPNGADKIAGLPEDVLAQVNAIRDNGQNFAVAQADRSSVSGQNVTDARDPNELDAGRSFS